MDNPPKPLRDEDNLWGFPHLTGTDKEKWKRLIYCTSSQQPQGNAYAGPEPNG